MFRIYEIKILLVCQVFMCHLYIYSLAFATVSYTWITCSLAGFVT